MRKILVLMLLLSGCPQETPAHATLSVGAIAKYDCGLPRNAPEIGVLFNGFEVTMARVDYLSLTGWRNEMQAWRECVLEHP